MHFCVYAIALFGIEMKIKWIMFMIIYYV